MALPARYLRVSLKYQIDRSSPGNARRRVSDIALPPGHVTLAIAVSVSGFDSV